MYFTELRGLIKLHFWRDHHKHDVTYVITMRSRQSLIFDDISECYGICCIENVNYRAGSKKRNAIGYSKNSNAVILVLVTDRIQLQEEDNIFLRCTETEYARSK